MSIRSVDERLDYMQAHPPNKKGMCARTSWLAIGGSNGTVPAWGCPDANTVYDKVKKSGRWFTGIPPKGALVLWKYGRYGHAALSLGNGRLLTTDPVGRPGKVGEESLAHPHRWGARASNRIWTDQYNGVRFPVGVPKSDVKGTVRLASLKYGKTNNSVKKLQKALGVKKTGYYGPLTDAAVRKHQRSLGWNPDKKGKSSVGPKQAKKLKLKVA